MGTPVLAEGGKAYLVHPWTHEVQVVPEGEAASFLSAGLRPATADEYRSHKTEEHYGSTEMAALATLAGAGRGLTFGLSDVAARQVGIAPESIRQVEEAHPGLSLGSEVVGSLASFAIPGAPGARLAAMGTKVGAGAGKLATRGAAHLAPRAGRLAGVVEKAPRLIQPIAREGFIGAGFGLGHGISEAAQHDLSVEETARTLLTGLAHGTTFGAGLGVLAFGGGIAGRALKKRFTNSTLGEIKELRKARSLITAEADAIKAAIPEGAEVSASVAQRLSYLEGKLGNISTDLASKQSQVLGKALIKATAAGVAISLDAGVTGGLLAAVVAPKALGLIRKTIAPALSKKLAPLLSRGGELAGQATPWVTRAKTAWAALRDVPIVGDLAEQAAQKGLTRAGQAAGKLKDRAVRTAAEKLNVDSSKIHSAVEGLGHGAGEAIGYAATYGTGEAALSGFVGGGLTGLAIGAGAHSAKHQLQKLGDLVLTKVVPAARVGALEAMTHADFEPIAEEIPHVDTTTLEAIIHSQLPEGLPENIGTTTTQQVLTAVKYLQDLHPTKGKPKDYKPTAQEKQKYQKVMLAVVNPGSILESFHRGNLTADQVKAVATVYPQAHRQLGAMVRAELAQAKAAGIKVPRNVLNQASLITGDISTKPGLYDFKRVAMMQQLHQANRGKPKQGRGAPQLADQHATATQRIGG